MRRILALAVPLLAAVPAYAEDAPPLETPFLVYGGSFDGKVQGEYSAPNGGKPRVTLYSDADFSFWANHSSWLSLNGDIKLERNRNDNLNSYYPDRNAAFRSETLTLRQLYLTLRPLPGLSVYGGKIHPKFGAAYAELPGTFYNFASDYEQDERIGFGIEYEVPESVVPGRLRASFEVYYLDTSFLSNTFPRGPSLLDPNADRAYRYTRAQYGPSNTGSLTSWTAALRGGQPEHGFTWQASFEHQETVEPGAKAEDGQSVSLSYDPSGDGIPLFGHVGVTPFAEYDHFSNFGTTPGLERHYALAGLAFKSGKWELDVAGGLRVSHGAGMNGTDHQENVTLTYELVRDLHIGVGIGHVTLDGRGSWTLAPALSYSRTF